MPDELLDLHTDRQLVGLGAILERIEMDLRAAPVMAALRLALLHAILPASRLGTGPGRRTTLRVASGHVRPSSGTQFRERNPWLAFEDAFRTVRGFIQRLDAGAHGPVQARLGEDLRSLGEGAATAFVGLTGPTGFVGLRDDPNAYGRTAPTPRIRLILGQPPMRPNLERLAAAYHATSWVLGREAAALLPLDGLAGASLRGPWAVQATSMAGALEAVEPAFARDGRVVWLVDGGPEATVATALGGAAAGYRLLGARLADPDDDAPAVVEQISPAGRLPPGSRTRANVGLEPLPGGAGDPGVVPSRNLFAPPEGFDDKPFSAAETARVVTEAAVETLRARGEPARFERLLGEILVGLDRSGQLRRFATATLRPGSGGAAASGDTSQTSARNGRGPPHRAATPAADPTATHADGAPETGDDGAAPPAPRTRRGAADRDAPTDAVERLLALIRDEFGRPTQRRLTEVEPGRWWLADADDLAAAETPLADRVEWAVYSLLSTAGPISETAFFDRMATMFNGPDLADAGLIRACLESYRSLASTPDRMVTSDDLLRRSQEHTDLLATIADGGRRLGMRRWIGRREQTRRLATAGSSATSSNPARSGSPSAGSRRPWTTWPRSMRSGTSAARSRSCSRSNGPRCWARRSCDGTPGSRRART